MSLEHLHQVSHGRIDGASTTHTQEEQHALLCQWRGSFCVLPGRGVQILHANELSKIAGKSCIYCSVYLVSDAGSYLGTGKGRRLMTILSPREFACAVI